MPSRVSLAWLEVHASHSCNLSCEGCSHYSNYIPKEVEDNPTILQDLKTWKDVLSPNVIRILGGEPLLNKNIVNILTTTREWYPESEIQLVSNGLLLRKDHKLWDILDSHNIVVCVSIHNPDNEQRIKNSVPSHIIRNKHIRYFYTNRVWEYGYYKTDGEGNILPYNSEDPTVYERCRNKHISFATRL